MAKKKMNLDVNVILSKNVILRLALGGMILITGYLKLKTGTTAFVEAAMPGFANTFIPQGLIKGFLTIVPTLELVVGAMLVLGLFANVAARVAGLMFALYIVALTAQNTAEGGVYVIGLFIYLFAAFKLICHNESPISLDYLIARKRK